MSHEQGNGQEDVAAQNAIFNKLLEQEYQNVHKMFLGDGSAVSPTTVLRMLAHISATTELTFFLISGFFDEVRNEKTPNGFQVGEGNSDFQASASGL